MGKSFIDTNVILYANDANAGAKRERAEAVIRKHIAAKTAVISTQVCMEYASVAFSKLRQPPDAIEDQLDLLARLEVVQVDVPLVRAGFHLMAAHSLSFWDAVILAAAQSARCEVLLTEDLCHGRLYGAVRVVDPFRSEA
jgi:predicted nucleic acid-binding protein